jgi:hypothetical protein
MYIRTQVTGIIYAVYYALGIVSCLFIAAFLFTIGNTYDEISAVFGNFLGLVILFSVVIVVFLFIWSIMIAKIGAGDAEQYAKRKGWVLAFIIINMLFFVSSLSAVIVLMASLVLIDGAASLFSITYLIILFMPVILSVLLILDLVKNKKDIAKLQ